MSETKKKEMEITDVNVNSNQKRNHSEVSSGSSVKLPSKKPGMDYSSEGLSGLDLNNSHNKQEMKNANINRDLNIKLINERLDRVNDVEQGMAARLQQLMNRVEMLEKDNLKLKVTCEEHEQYSRRNSLRIFGLREQGNEFTDQLIQDFCYYELGLHIDASQIDRSHRVGQQRGGRPRPIICKFVAHNTKELVLRRYADSDLGKKWDSPYLVVEDLTRFRASLAFQARDAKKHHAIRDTWTYDGRIYVVKSDGRKTVINTHEELSFCCQQRPNAVKNSVATKPAFADVVKNIPLPRNNGISVVHGQKAAMPVSTSYTSRPVRPSHPPATNSNVRQSPSNRDFRPLRYSTPAAVHPPGIRFGGVINYPTEFPQLILTPNLTQHPLGADDSDSRNISQSRSHSHSNSDPQIPGDHQHQQ